MSTFNSFIQTFNNTLREVATIDDTETLQVINHAMVESGLKDVFNDISRLREENARLQKGGAVVETKTTATKRTTSKRAVAQDSDSVVVEDADTKAPATRARKTTAAKAEKPAKGAGRVTAYNLFVAEKVSEKINLKDAAAQWKELSKSDKAPYEERAKDQNQRNREAAA